MSGQWTGASLFAGIGGFELGLQAAGVKVVASVEKDEKALGVLAHQFPDVTLFDDVQNVSADDLLRAGFVPERGILTAGFPCQDVSLAGKRAGLAGARSGLFFEIIRILKELQPRWFLLENVPGLLSSNDGRDMGTVVGTLDELGYGVGWRVLDAQHFGVPQRRRRVFIAGCLGDLARAGEVLLEPEGSPGDRATRRAPGQEAAGAAADSAVGRSRGGLLADRGIVQGLTTARATGGPDAAHAQAGWLIPEQMPVPEIAGTLTARYHKGINTTLDDGAQVVSFRKSKRAQTDEDYETWLQEDQTNTLNCFDTGEARATQLLAQGFALQPHKGEAPGDNLRAVHTEVSPSLTSSQLARGSDRGLRVVSVTGDKTHTLTADGFDASEDGTGRGWPTVGWEWGVRRLTPMECERLQGFPDGHTEERIEMGAKSKKKGSVVVQSDSARGHQLGNAVAVPVVSWISARIVASEEAA